MSDPWAPRKPPRGKTIEKPLVFVWFWQKLCSRLAFEGGASRPGSFGAPKCVTVVTFERRFSRNDVKMGTSEKNRRHGRRVYIYQVLSPSAQQRNLDTRPCNSTPQRKDPTPLAPRRTASRTISLGCSGMLPNALERSGKHQDAALGHSRALPRGSWSARGVL